MNFHEQFNKDTYGTFKNYILRNRQKRNLGIYVHLFTVGWGITTMVEGAPWYLSLVPLPILVVYWYMSWRNFKGKTV